MQFKNYSDHGQQIHVYNEQNELLGLIKHVLSEEFHGYNELIFGISQLIAYNFV